MSNFHILPSKDAELCPNFMDFGTSEKRFGRISWSQKIGTPFYHICFKLFKVNDEGEMRKYQQVYIGKEEFKRFCIVKSSTLNDAQSMDGLKELKINGNASWSGSDMEQELSLCHSVVDLEHNGNRRVSLTIKRYDMKDVNSTYIQLRLFLSNQQFACVNYKLSEFADLVKVLNETNIVGKCNIL